MVTIAPVVDLPTGHLRLTFPTNTRTEELAAERRVDVQAEPQQGWTVYHDEGSPCLHTPRGASALPELGVVAFGGSSWR